MDLVTYEDVRRYARRVRAQVANKLMPPYYYDADIGIQELQHDWRLSQEDINTIVAWVDQGAPLGNADDMPPPPKREKATRLMLQALSINSTPIRIPIALRRVTTPMTPTLKSAAARPRKW